MWQKIGVFPVWAVALVVAAAAPLLVRLFADWITRRVRERTEPIAAALTTQARKKLGRKRDSTHHEEA